MSLSKIILSAAGILKPVLIRIIPIRTLKKIKGQMIKNSLNKVLTMQVMPMDRMRYPDGVNLIGNVKAETGLGQSCRLVARELEGCCVPYSVYQYNQLGIMSNNDTSLDSKIQKELPFNINLIHINPHELGLALIQMDKSVWNYRYNIGFWLWELEEFPDEWTPYFQRLDEIWTPSEFISQAIRKKTDLPVITVPYHVEAAIEKEYSRSFFGLPEDLFLLLMMYDKSSVSERKNPKGVIEAYKSAFQKQNDTGLVIKINNCSEEEIQELKEEIGDCSHVYFITDSLDRNQVNNLIHHADVVVSLHRAEGFGLVLAEAMLLGTPTIATNWSSNTEFMTSEVACMVDYKLVKLKEDVGLFKKGNYWAEPDVKQAAAYMQRLYGDSTYYHEIAKKAQKYIKDCLSMEQAVDIIDKRVKEIYSKT